MLWEMWQAWRTPVNLSYVKPMGYLHESVAMRARSKRCSAEWQAHYQQCRASIIEAVDYASQQCDTKQKTVLIFGAGHLMDTPLEALSSQFKSIFLVDLLFSKATQQQVEPFENVRLIEHDVTENLARIFHANLNTANDLQVPQRWLADNSIGLVISLNLITQLPLLPAKYLIKHTDFSLQQAEQLSQQMIAQHLTYLRGFDCPVCLIADRNIEEYDRNGQRIDEYNPWWEIQPPLPHREWHWQVAPFGEINTKTCQIHKVGVSFLKRKSMSL